MDWPWLLERVSTAVGLAKDLVLAGVAISGAIVGWKALTKWREETVGKRRLELAGEVLSAFYQIQEVTYDARSPMIWASEMVKEAGVPDEVVGDSAYGPIRRLRQSFDHIRTLRTKRHRFAALFGREAPKPWDEIEAVLNEINAASEAILMLHGEHIPPSDPQAKFYREQRQILARRMDDDPITPRLLACEVRSPNIGALLLEEHLLGQGIVHAHRPRVKPLDDRRGVGRREQEIARIVDREVGLSSDGDCIEPNGDPQHFGPTEVAVGVDDDPELRLFSRVAEARVCE